MDLVCCIPFRRELAQLAALPLQNWLASALQTEIDKIMDAKRAAGMTHTQLA